MSSSQVADVTVVVATRNRCDRLLDMLGRCRAPVIVVDNASEDGTPDAVAARFPEVQVVRLADNRGAAARNVGVALARTPFVAFADDDSYWVGDSLVRAGRLLREHPSTGLLAASVLVGARAQPDPICAAMAAAPLGVIPGQPGPAVLGFLACAAVVRRRAFLGVGGFNPALHVYGEEALLALDLAAAGWQLSYAPSLVVHHLPSPAGRDESRRRRLEFRNRVLTALLRRPASVVIDEVRKSLRRREGRAALVDIARLLPWALRHRRVLPRQVEQAARILGEVTAAGTLHSGRPTPATS